MLSHVTPILQSFLSTNSIFSILLSTPFQNVKHVLNPPSSVPPPSIVAIKDLLNLLEKKAFAACDW